jgi:DNA-nicking Smr family endonuclease
LKQKTEHLSAEDADLFRQTLDDVTPLPPLNRLSIKPPELYFRPNIPLATAALPDALSDHLSDESPIEDYLSNGLSRMTLRKLRRGEWLPQDSLDLHGLNSEQARKLLLEFLHHASENNLRCVAVVHGKGWRSEGREGILKTLTRHWLTQLPQVLAFCEAPQNAGGGGVVWALLKLKPCYSKNGS